MKEKEEIDNIDEVRKQSTLRLIYWMIKNNSANVYNFKYKVFTPKEWFLKRRKTASHLAELIQQGYVREVEDIKGGPNVYQVTQKYSDEVRELFKYEKWKITELPYKARGRDKILNPDKPKPTKQKKLSIDEVQEKFDKMDLTTIKKKIIKKPTLEISEKEIDFFNNIKEL